MGLLTALGLPSPAVAGRHCETGPQVPQAPSLTKVDGGEPTGKPPQPG